MRLKDLIADMPQKKVIGNPDVEIQGIAYHSAKVNRGTLFVALYGMNVDGHNFTEEALDRGAAALVVTRHQGIDRSVPLVIVPDGRAALAQLSATFFGHPSRGMRLIGVTGTNGKTTTSYLIESIFKNGSLACGVIGTINYRFGGSVMPAPMTTPESYDIQRILREMLDSGITDVVIEVSSHGVDLKRVDSCHFDVGVFTNFSQDHLDYHTDLEQYRQCKEHLFTTIIPGGDKPKRMAVINLDDPTGEKLWHRLSYTKTGYGIHRRAPIWAQEVTNSVEGVEATVHTSEGTMGIHSPLVGDFNIYNIMAAMGTAMALGISEASIQDGIQTLSSVPGRMERIENDQKLKIFVDYAHTPDALERALMVLRPLRTKGRLITVFGCGGDRDRTKRPLMGGVVARLSDLSIITSDNPRSELPGKIIQEIEFGFTSHESRSLEREDLEGRTEIKGYIKIENRKEAIRLAIRTGRPGDIILVAGKGHEDYQILGDRRIPFDDRTEVRRALQKKFTKH
jgi:UDP-N-acetylmuramoyl-L-alanyl-D-glutamate--2,6-diaminopimelate ligase